MSKPRYALALAFAVSLSVFSSSTSSAANYLANATISNDPASHVLTSPIPSKQDLANQKLYGEVFMSDVPVAGSVIEAVIQGVWEPNATFRYQWVYDNRAVSTEPTYEIPLAGTSKRLGVSVFADVPGYYSIQVESPVATIVEPAVNISGLPKVGEELVAEVGTLSSKIRLYYDWNRDGKPIPNDLFDKYKVLPQDLGHNISVTATLFEQLPNSLTTTVTLTSSSSLIARGTMVPRTPTLYGTPKVGSTLTAKTTSWVSGARITYQWMLDGKAIKGATKSTYKILSTQKGKKISVVITQSALGYTTASKTSLSVKIP